MAIRFHENVVGAWAYTLGVVLATIIGVIFGLGIDVPYFSKYVVYAYALLVFFGLLVGFLNVNSKDIPTFLLAGVSLVIVNSLASQALTQSVIAIGDVGIILKSVFSALLLLFVPATIIVALKSLFSISKV